jgi:uncharacterized membrane protein
MDFLITTNLIPQWVPNIHPILVHFPIVLFFFAVLMDFLSFFVPENWWNERITIVTYFLGVISVIVVYFTGKMAQGTLQNLSAAAQQAVIQHQNWAIWTLWFFVIYTLARVYLFFTQKIQIRKWHVLMFLISLAGLFLLYKTGEHGGKLVYKYGLSTQSQKVSVIRTNPTFKKYIRPGYFVQITLEFKR